MSKTKLIIDGQIFQTEAKDRGMGRYTVYLIRSIIEANTQYDEIELLITTKIITSDQARDELKSTFPGITLTELPLRICQNIRLEKALNENKELLNRYIAKQQKNGYEVDYLVPSLFQEPLASVFPANAKKLLIIYDLIPYLYHQRYEMIMGPGFTNYLKRFKYMFEADKIFTISQTVLNDNLAYLGIPQSKMVRIDGAAIRSSLPPQKPQISIPQRYVLMPTSDDPRKNNTMAVLGFEEYVATAEDNNLKLVITSHINKQERNHLKRFSKNLVFTGSLPDRELDWLYENSAAVLFVPEYEGLGLPVLEAVEFDKPVACSSIGAFKEISADAFCYCDYEDSSSIADALGKALNTKPDPAAYAKISAYYTWLKTAQRFLDGARATAKSQPTEKPKIALFAPTPDGLSAIGKIVAESHAVLSEHFQIDYYIEKGNHQFPTRPNFLKFVAKTYPAEAFNVKRYGEYDAVVYHIGNGDYHLQSLKNALYLPGIIITHDTNITEAWRVMAESGLAHAGRVVLEEALTKNSKGQAKGLASVVDRQLGVLAHSRYAAKNIRLLSNKPVIAEANLPSGTPPVLADRPKGKFTIGLAGIIADIKGLEVLEAIAANPLYRNCDIKLFGFSFVSDETLGRLNSYDNVSVAVGVTDLEFQNNLSKLDVFVNYRLGYNGETSLSTIEAMRSGAAVIVRDVGWYSELPDDVVIKAKNIDEVFNRLNELLVYKKTVRNIGKKAQQYIAANYDHEQYAQKLAALIRETSSRGSSKSLVQALKKGKIRTYKQYLKFLGGA